MVRSELLTLRGQCSGLGEARKEADKRIQEIEAKVDSVPPPSSSARPERFSETPYEQRTIAVMGCRVNGPGETDDADLGLWCGPARPIPPPRLRLCGCRGC